MSQYETAKSLLAELTVVERSDRFKNFKLAGRVVACRKLYEAGETQTSLAQRFGVDPKAIRDCVTFKTYRNV